MLFRSQFLDYIVVAVLQATTINLHFISNRNFVFHTQSYNLLSILVHKVHYIKARYIVFSLGSNSWIAFQIEVPPIPESKIRLMIVVYKTKLHAKQQ
jgi:branched-subunit amino acid transport protein